MFRCQQCDATDFALVLQPGFSGQVDIRVDEAEDVVITVNDQSFVADLAFINQFGVCKGCDGIGHWDYYYPKSLSENSP